MINRLYIQFQYTVSFFITLLKSQNHTITRYNFSDTEFRARKTILGAHPCMWKIMHIKEQTCTLLIITWFSGRKCTKLVLKPLTSKNGLSISVLCTAPFLYYTISVYMMTTLHSRTLRGLLHCSAIFSINWNKKRCSKSNVVTMDHELVPENPIQLLFITHCRIPLSTCRMWSIWKSGRDRSIKLTWNLK